MCEGKINYQFKKLENREITDTSNNMEEFLKLSKEVTHTHRSAHCMILFF